MVGIVGMEMGEVARGRERRIWGWLSIVMGRQGVGGIICDGVRDLGCIMRLCCYVVTLLRSEINIV